MKEKRPPEINKNEERPEKKSRGLISISELLNKDDENESQASSSYAQVIQIVNQTKSTTDTNAPVESSLVTQVVEQNKLKAQTATVEKKSEENQPRGAMTSSFKWAKKKIPKESLIDKPGKVRLRQEIKDTDKKGAGAKPWEKHCRRGRLTGYKR